MRISDWSSDVCSSDLQVRRDSRRKQTGLTNQARPEGPRCTRRGGGDFNQEQCCRNRHRAHAKNADESKRDQRRHGKRQDCRQQRGDRSEENTSELKTLMRITNSVLSTTNKTKI